MGRKRWSEDPNTELECDECKTTWKLGDSIGCPKCNGIDNGIGWKKEKKKKK